MARLTSQVAANYADPKNVTIGTRYLTSLYM